MDQQLQQLIDRIKQAQNVLVTVSTSPSVDQLAAAIGLTIALNKLDKHGTAVFSGQVPSTIEFLKPGETLEKNTDSLRDFIIALDKSKADKLRYKVEDEVVRIFITPYRTSLSQRDLQFSQGDFNVDVVVALGVGVQQDLDAAITAHGRILHDATVASVSTAGRGDLGTINWVNTNASSLSEMMLDLIDGLDKSLLDNQIATALLTGIVATTDRFRNEKTTPETMQISAELMAAGANQQLIASELETRPPMPEKPQSIRKTNVPKPQPQQAAAPQRKEPGELDIEHKHLPQKVSPEELRAPALDPDFAEQIGQPEPPKPQQPQIRVDEDGKLSAPQGFVPPPVPIGNNPQSSPLDERFQAPLPEISEVHGVGEADGDQLGGPEVQHRRLTGKPSMDISGISANTAPEDEYEPPTEELTLPSMNGPLLSHNETVLPSTPPPPKVDDNPFLPQAPLLPSTPPPTISMPSTPPVSAPAPMSLPLPSLSPVTSPTSPPISPLVSMPTPPASSLPPPPPPPPPFSPASASLIPSETLEEIEEAVHSPHLQQEQTVAGNVNDARSAVEAALNNANSPANQPPLPPITALNAMPMGDMLHANSSPAINTGFSEPTPGNTPADATMDMPIPSNPFGPGQQSAPSPSGQAPAANDGIPPVPPPFVPPVR